MSFEKCGNIEELREAYMKVERKFIATALRQCRWNLTSASGILGMPRTSLLRMLEHDVYPEVTAEWLEHRRSAGRPTADDVAAAVGLGPVPRQ